MSGKVAPWIAILVGILSLVGAAVAVGGRNEKIDAQEKRLERVEREAVKKEAFNAWAPQVEKRLDRIEKGQDMLNDKVNELLRRSERR